MGDSVPLSGRGPGCLNFWAVLKRCHQVRRAFVAWCWLWLLLLLWGWGTEAGKAGSGLLVLLLRTSAVMGGWEEEDATMDPVARANDSDGVGAVATEPELTLDSGGPLTPVTAIVLDLRRFLVPFSDGEPRQTREIPKTLEGVMRGRGGAGGAGAGAGAAAAVDVDMSWSWSTLPVDAPPPAGTGSDVVPTLYYMYLHLRPSRSGEPSALASVFSNQPVVHEAPLAPSTSPLSLCGFLSPPLNLFFISLAASFPSSERGPHLAPHAVIGVSGLSRRPPRCGSLPAAHTAFLDRPGGLVRPQRPNTCD
jgi:hypothetical protein